MPLDRIPHDPACPWCNPGGSGDANGSHRICPGHAADLDAETNRLAEFAEADRMAFERAHGPTFGEFMRRTS